MKQLRVGGFTDLSCRAWFGERWQFVDGGWGRLIMFNRSVHSAWLGERWLFFDGGWQVADVNRHVIGLSLRGATPILPM